MNLFVTEVVTPPVLLPITIKEVELGGAVVEEIERTILWRAIVAQERRIVISGPLPSRIEIEPVTSIVSLTRWTPTDDEDVVDVDSYDFVSRDPAGTTIFAAPGKNWPAPERAIGSFALTYWSGWEVTGSTNSVPLLIQLMVSRAVEFRAGAGLGDIGIGALKLDVAPSYSTDQLPREIASLGRAWAYRPGIFSSSR